MASYFRPRRGNKSIAESQDIILKRGEVFFEIDASGISTGSAAKACGKIKMGDGSTTYSNLGYFIDVDTSVVAFTDTSTATSTNQGADYYTALNDVAPSATVKSIFGNIKLLLYRLATNITTLNNKAPFAFGVDANNNYGYIKAGADTVTPFRSAPSGNKALGTYSSVGSQSANISGYETCSFTVNTPAPTGNKALGTYTTAGSKSANISGYETCSFTVNVPGPSGNKSLGTKTNGTYTNQNVSGYETCSFQIPTNPFYNDTPLWSNPDFDVLFGAQTVTLSQSYKNFKYLIIYSIDRYKYDYYENTLRNIFLTSEVANYTPYTTAAGSTSIRGSIGDFRMSSTNGTHSYTRMFWPLSDTEIHFHTAEPINNTVDTKKGSFTVPIWIYGSNGITGM